MNKIFLFILFFVSVALSAPAASFSAADSLFAQKNYVDAAAIYAAHTKEASPDVFYNLGNCCYRQKKYGEAVLNYLRALRLQPAHEDAAFNLALTRTKLADRFDQPSQMFFITWFDELMASRSAACWGTWALAMLCLALLCLSAFFFSPRVWQRKVGFFSAIAFTALVVVFNIFAYVANDRFNNERLAVVMGSTKLCATPSADKTVRNLSEGTTLRINEAAQGAWLQVTLPDGKEGWVEKTAVEEVVAHQNN